ncbi:MAG: Ig-like domain-containing protein [Leucobacter sp.]
MRAARGWIAGGISCALIVTIAVVANGYDAQETPREEASVWVHRDSGQYARVNTETGEIDTVRRIDEPSGLVQSADRSVAFSHGNGRAWPIDAAMPVDLGDSAGASDDESDDPGITQTSTDNSESSENADAESGDTDSSESAIRMPDGTRDVLSADGFVAVRTDDGGVFVADISGEQAEVTMQTPDQGFAAVQDLTAAMSNLRPVNPIQADVASDSTDGEETEADEEPEQYRAEAIALGGDGTLVLYSAEDGEVRFFNIGTEEFDDAQAVPAAAADSENLQFAIVAGDWVLFDAESGSLWRDGAESVVEVDTDASAKLQASGIGGGAALEAVLIADSTGLLQVPVSAAPERVVEADGTPAQPVTVGNDRYAAWLNTSGGTLWRSEAQTDQDAPAETETAEPVTLEIDPEAGDLGEPNLEFRTNGDRAVLAETGTGLLWTVSDGQAIPLAQWTISDPPKEDRGNVVVEEVTEQVAPTAVDDAFGVRAGEQAPLPVLLNDFDANSRDVLTIIPDSLEEAPLPEEFGTVQLLADAQSLAVQPTADATGTATFSYRVTDGTHVSDPATVTLTVVADDVNTAPAWCPVEGCQREWRVPDIAPGGTLVHPILEGWVDPEGDPMRLTNVEVVQPSDPVRAIVSADGRLAVRHTDANGSATDTQLTVTVEDSHGEKQERNLQVRITPDAAAEFSPTAASITVGETSTLRVLDRVSGGSGSFALVDAVVQGSGIDVRAQRSNGTVSVSASGQGSAIVTLTVQDVGTGSEITGLMRVTATESNQSLALPPLRAFVRPLADSTVEVLDAIPGSNARAISVRSAEVADGQLQADVIEHARVRVAGSTPTGVSGRIGAVDVTITEGEETATGKLTVFQVPDNTESSAIAVGDAATVRAGSVVDIRVLDNDVSAPGERLVLHPEITGSGTTGELAFASGSTLRYLAPEREGTYTLKYTTYGASSPEAGDVGTVTVTVIGKGSNQDPEPRTLTTRVAPGEQREVQVPLSGADPDGDRVRLIGVGTSPDPQLSASLAPNTGGISISASGAADLGTHFVDYMVRDEFGGTATGKLRVIVTEQSSEGVPILSSDYVRVVAGSTKPATVLPLGNDLDPAGGRLTIESVEPNVAGGSSNPAYRALAERLDLTEMKKGRVTIAPGGALGTVSYRYTAKSSATSSTSDGLILVQTSERVGAQAPSITDSVLSVRDRSELSTRGVDVVTDKVRWAAGDPSGLELSLWNGNDGNYRVQGNRIVGTYNPAGDLVVFRLSGVDSADNEVSSYGFLVIPSLDELKLTLQPGLSPITVDEGESESVRIHDLLELGRGDVPALRQTTFPSSRDQATCEATGQNTLRYNAGSEAPWADTCMMDVRLEGQSTWTTLPVPVNIVPRDPVAELAHMTRTIAPGASEQIDLTEMVRWQGGREGDSVNFAVSGAGSMFDVQQSGPTVTVTAHADATPRAQQALTVSTRGSGDSSAQLTLRVGEAARDLPQGATVGLTCTVGSSCTTTVIGAAGEYDPFAGKAGGGLTLASVSGGSCAFGDVSRANDTDVRVTWPDSRGPGGKCTIGFTVQDAQGRTGEGSVELDARGVPRAPSSLTWTDFGPRSVTFSVELSSGQSAHPAVSNVEISGPGNSSCSASGGSSYQCTVTGLSNGVKGTYTARAVNSVGSSASSTQVTAWAYRAPEAPTVTVTQEETPRNTNTERGTVRVRVEGAADVASYSVRVGDSEIATINGSSGRTGEHQVAAGTRTFTAVPASRFEVPPIAASSPSAGVGKRDFTVAGAPKISSVRFEAEGDGAAGTVRGNVDPNGASNVETRYGLMPETDGCRRTNNSDHFQGLTPWELYTPIVCAQTVFGQSELAGSAVRPSSDLPAYSEATYSVNPRPETGADGSKRYERFSVNLEGQSVEGASPYYSTGSELVLSPAGNGALEVWRCLDSDSSVCSPKITVTPQNAPTTVTVTPTGECLLADGTNAADTVQVSAAAAGDATATASGSRVTVSFGGPFASLNNAILNVNVCTE